MVSTVILHYTADHAVDAAAVWQYSNCLPVVDIHQVHGIIKYNNISDPMPQNIDSNFDALVYAYADIEV